MLLDFLNPHSYYTYRVSAVTVGNGPYSDRRNFTTEDDGKQYSDHVNTLVILNPLQFQALQQTSQLYLSILQALNCHGNHLLKIKGMES